MGDVNDEFQQFESSLGESQSDVAERYCATYVIVFMAYCPA